ncbi:MAG: hypothetical protein GTN43_02915 [Candidatus Aenigmarchaeota archaeon]|nr:hypothetical protein [Candidatus Aenigmarchaeota archaeon]
MIEKKLDRSGEGFYYRNEETGDEYRRVVGGMGWPFKEKPGFIVVVAEDFAEIPGPGKRRLTVIYEKEDDQIEGIFRKVIEAQRFHWLEGIWGNRSHENMMALIRQFNDEQNKKQGALVHILYAPKCDEPDNLTYYAHIIKKQLTKPRNLYFGPESQFPSYLSALPSEKVKGLVDQWPAIAALGYALAALEVHGPEIPRDKLQKTALMDYDPFADE